MTTDTTTAAIEALPIETAPKDGTMLRLLVDYTDEGENPLEDQHQAWTIGFNQLSDTDEDVWEFAGWSWEQDCFTAGIGKVIGWLPFHAARDAGNALGAELATARADIEAGAKDYCGLMDRHDTEKVRADNATAELAALRKEVERLREALTPSGDTKAAYFGEVKMSVSACIEDDDGEFVEMTHAVPVDWTATKETMAMILKRAAITAEPLGHGVTADDFGGEA